MKVIEADSPEGISRFKKYYEAHDYKVDLCKLCGKIERITYPKELVDGPSNSSGMWCICPAYKKTAIEKAV